jgi:hypothetical protein
MCCLRYEHEFYVQSRRRFPKEGRILQTSVGEEKVLACDIFNERVTLRSADGDTRVVALADLKLEISAADDAPVPAAADSALLLDVAFAPGSSAAVAAVEESTVELDPVLIDDIVPVPVSVIATDSEDDAPDSSPANASTDEPRRKRRRGRRGGRRLRGNDNRGPRDDNATNE